ncbi:LacI family DNA-binding transcriptional regulator [Hahella sp. CR1]|uniref:LacI family DNA-binding transcriptional regulator n=1 Tax=Hahella sp. CR1 TaxID=2992807 RepID=UPI0024421824|nr:LacI family DNA-binding transcriptional regulator [Hahella sp. CR1]MDG9668681.1 LacI family DNA-binding transcriptional regulator [Hahella sp. CR1]
MKKLTLKDVASELGVSTATISNAYNRPDQLSAKLRSHILKECLRLGYNGPNATAASLRRGTSGIIGVMVADRLHFNFTDPVASQFLQGVAEVFDSNGVNMFLLPTRAGYYKHRSIESVPDAFIMYGRPNDESIVERILQQQKTLITVDFDLGESHTSINVDNFSGARESAEHAFKRSDGEAAIIGLRLLNLNEVRRIKDAEMFGDEISISRRRLNGYLAAAEAMDRHIRPDMIWHTPDSNFQNGYQAAREALSASPRPRILLCMSDRLALAAIQASLDLGFKVPDDVKVVGFDDIPDAAHWRPSLTTVHQPSVAKGRLAAQAVLKGDTSNNRLLTAQLVVRESC